MSRKKCIIKWTIVETYCHDFFSSSVFYQNNSIDPLLVKSKYGLQGLPSYSGTEVSFHTYLLKAVKNMVVCGQELREVKSFGSKGGCGGWWKAGGGIG